MQQCRICKIGTFSTVCSSMAAATQLVPPRKRYLCSKVDFSNRLSPVLGNKHQVWSRWKDENTHEGGLVLLLVLYISLHN